MSALVKVLRRQRFAVTAGKLAEETGVSIRTLCRDIGALTPGLRWVPDRPGRGSRSGRL